MSPTLFDIGSWSVHPYGVMLALSFVLGFALASRRAGRRGIPQIVLIETSLVILFAALLGSRVMYVLFHLDEIHTPLDLVTQWTGLTMYGGVLAVYVAVWFFLKKRDVSYLVMADVVAPSVALGLGLTRIGCFLTGCCFGEPTHGPLGVEFPSDSLAGRTFGHQPLHPTQLYSSFTGLLILVVLLRFDRGPRRTGEVFGLLLILEATGRFILDFFRYYEANSYTLGGLTVNQLISIGLFALGAVLMVRAPARVRPVVSEVSA